MMDVKKVNKKKKKRGYNLSLLIGSIILAVMLLMIIMDERLISSDPYSLDWGAEYIVEDEVIKIEHPIQPNPIDKLGTDPLGRNVLSLLVAGTKVTVGIAFIATVIRTSIGVIASIYINQLRKRTTVIQYILTLLVGILVPYLILKISYFKTLELLQAIFVYGIVIGLFGWLRISGKISLGKEDFEGIGNKGRKDLIKEIGPNIAIIFFREMGISLIILCALGLLGITIGADKYAGINTSWGPIPNYYPDWGGLLAISSQAAKKGAYWLIAFPLLFFLIGISGFFLTSRGLLYNYEKTGSIVSSPMRHIINFISPIQYIKDIKRFSWNRSTVIVKSLIIAIILTLVIRSNLYFKEMYPINLDRALKDLEYINEITKKYGANSKEARDKIAQYILDQMEGIYGLYPVFQDGFLQNVEGKGKNIAGYIWGRSSNHPLLLVADYGNGFDNTSVAALLELARSLGSKHHEQMASRTMVFLFVDGTLEDGEGLKHAIGNTNIERKSFYIDLNCIGLGDKIFIDKSTVFSGNERHYRNVRLIQKNAKGMGIPVKQDFFDFAFQNAEVFKDNKISGLAISGISIEEYEKYNRLDESSPTVDNSRFEKHLQYLMNIATEYSWSDKPWLGDRY
jgi:ABC-type dipeptide/oligopeptide/nickel transport system permease subunit